MFDNNNVGLAFRQYKLYLVSLSDSINEVNPSSNVNVSTKHKYSDDETSSKLWHYHWAIFRGGIERLIKEQVLHPLDFSDADLDHCIDCIKGKYSKRIKKGANRSTGALENVHMDICGPSNVKSVDGFDSL